METATSNRHVNAFTAADEVKNNIKSVTPEIYVEFRKGIHKEQNLKHNSRNSSFFHYLLGSAFLMNLKKKRTDVKLSKWTIVLDVIKTWLAFEMQLRYFLAYEKSQSPIFNQIEWR